MIFDEDLGFTARCHRRTRTIIVVIISIGTVVRCSTLVGTMSFTQVSGLVIGAIAAVAGCGIDRVEPAPSHGSTADGEAPGWASPPPGTAPVTGEAVVQTVTPVCTVTIEGPTSAVIGPAIHLTAYASCNVGTPEIQWWYRVGNHAFAMFQQYSTPATADFVTTTTTPGVHQFFARARSQGTTPTFTSNTIDVAVSDNVGSCTAVVIGAPLDGSFAGAGQPIAMQAAASCPAGTTPEYQFWVKQVGQANWTILPAYVTGPSSFTPTATGDWAVTAVARAIGAHVAFQVRADSVVVTISDPPVAQDDTLVVDEDHAGKVAVLANDSDPNGDALTATISGAPAAGTATIAAGVVTYRPATDYHGTDAITYTASDGHGNAVTAVVHVTVNSVNDRPAAFHDWLEVAEDGSGSVDVTLNDVDVDGDALAVSAISAPDHGTASFAGPVVTYTPAPDYAGDDSFQYTVSDGHGGTGTATVFVEVAPVNDPPVAVDDVLTVAEDTEGGVYLLGNDLDADGETPAIVAFDQPAHGSVSVVAGFASYHPAPDYHGPDAFSYTARDAAGASSTATVHITVLPVNDPPVAADDAGSLDEDAGVTLDVVANDSDVEGDALALVGVTQPAHGTAVIASGHTITYTPAPDFAGSDAFTYTIADPSGAQATATVTLAIANVNDAPVAVADAASLDEDAGTALAVVANDHDADGDALTIASVTQPAHGSAVILDATHAGYTPEANYHGPDAFTYTIADGHGGEASAAVTLAVIAVNDAPVAADDVAGTDEDAAVTIDVLANDGDADGDALAVTAVTPPAHGVAEIADAGHVRYTPAPDFHGADAFTYTVGDGAGGLATATVTLDVAAVNDAPVAAGDAASLAEDTSATIDVVANDGDVDGDALAITDITPAAHGEAVIAGEHHILYTPAANYHGPDALTYTIDDGHGGQATATLALDVESVNDAPIAGGDAANLDEDAAVTVDVVANDFDIDGDALAITAITQPAHGLAVRVDDHHVTYLPAPDYHGPDAVAYTVGDGHGGQATAELVLEVASVNDAPVAANDAAGLDEDAAVTVEVVANDGDADGDALVIASVTQPAHGEAVIVDDHHVHYTPAANYHGADELAYTIDDGHGGQATATLALDVQSVNDAPVASDDAQAVAEDTSASIDVAGNDTDLDGDELAVASVTQPAHGSAAIVDGHHVSYTPAANFHGADALQYTIDDGHGGQATAAVTLDVTSVNDAPVAAGVAVQTFDDTAVMATLVASDVDGDALAFAIAGAPAHGTLGAVIGSHVTYTPAPGFAGADAFTYTASDGQVSSVAATVTVTVVRSVCGNGVREGREECDDGNAAPGDGCEPSCKLTCGSGTGADRATVDAASGHCFAAYDGVHHSYQEAAALCAGFGGHLATIGSDAEDDAAFAAVHAGDHPWLGGDDLAIEGTFRWTTGESMAGYTNFAAGKPDNAGNADCLRYLSDGTWTDTGCDGAAVSGALCELELATTTPVFATGGTGTRGVALADVNGDGYPDLAATNPASNSVGILLGNGAGGFALQATYATGTGPTAIATGDFDGDGRTDLAVVNATASTVSILRGTAGGTFTAPTTAAIAAGATALAAADYDQDGKLDLAIAATGTVQVLRGNGSGGFSALPSVAITGAPAAIAAGDFDRDGRSDLVVTTAAAVLVVRSTGPGAFAVPVTLATSATNRAVVAADLDGDGNLDLAVASGAATLTVWFGTAAGVFGAPASLTVAGAPLAVVAGDFDGDGGTDLAAVTSNFATVFHGAGRTFTAAGAPIATGGGGASFAVAANVNGDAAQDLVVANATTSTAGVLLGGAGGLGGARALVFGTASSSTVSGDFNQDSRADLAVVDPSTSKIAVYLQAEGGALVQSTVITMPAGSGPTYAVTADFDGDGRADLAIASVNFSSVSVVLGAGNGTFGAPLNTGVAQSPRRLAVGDFNGDGRPDLAVPAALGNTVTILTNTGGGRFGTAGNLPAGVGPSAVAVGDFNGDGKKDLAVATTGEATVRVMIGRGDNTFLAATTFAVASGSQAIAAGDLDGDGKLDLAATCTATGNVSILRGTGTGGFAAAVNVATGAQPSAVVAVDLDGDARLDLVVGNAGTADVTVLHNDGAGGFVAFRVGVGGPLSWVTVADLDRDGHLDIIASSATTLATLLFSAR
jgi:large repetitive protein